MRCLPTDHTTPVHRLTHPCTATRAVPFAPWKRIPLRRRSCRRRLVWGVLLHDLGPTRRPCGCWCAGRQVTQRSLVGNICLRCRSVSHSPILPHFRRSYTAAHRDILSTSSHTPDRPAPAAAPVPVARSVPWLRSRLAPPAPARLPQTTPRLTDSASADPRSPPASRAGLAAVPSH